MHTIGIDLGVKGEHKAIVADEGGRFVSPLIGCRTEPGSLARLLSIAGEGNGGQQRPAVLVLLRAGFAA